MVLQMAKELDAILDHGDAIPAASCTIENDSVSFLKQIVEPIYETLAAVSGLYFIFMHLTLLLTCICPTCIFSSFANFIRCLLCGIVWSSRILFLFCTPSRKADRFPGITNIVTVFILGAILSHTLPVMYSNRFLE